MATALLRHPDSPERIGIENLNYCAKFGLDVFDTNLFLEVCQTREHLQPDLGILIFQEALVNWDDVLDCSVFLKLGA